MPSLLQESQFATHDHRLNRGSVYSIMHKNLLKPETNELVSQICSAY